MPRIIVLVDVLVSAAAGATTVVFRTSHADQRCGGLSQ
jgi:hypothetical protein